VLLQGTYVHMYGTSPTIGRSGLWLYRGPPNLLVREEYDLLAQPWSQSYVFRHQMRHQVLLTGKMGNALPPSNRVWGGELTTRCAFGMAWRAREADSVEAKRRKPRCCSRDRVLAARPCVKLPGALVG